MKLRFDGEFLAERKLSNMPFAQAKVREFFDGDILQSYKTDVIIHKVVVCPRVTHYYEVTWLYSATTRKHISAYARERGLCYGDFKRAYELDAYLVVLDNGRIEFIDKENGCLCEENASANT